MLAIANKVIGQGSFLHYMSPQLALGCRSSSMSVIKESLEG